jgi:hypothetical protein
MVTNLGVPGLTAGITTALPGGANDASAQVSYLKPLKDSDA